MNKSLLDSISKVKEEKNVEEIYLFGSVARGDEDEYSDIDILIVIDDCTEDEYIDWKNIFSNYLDIPVSWISLYRHSKILRMYEFGSYFLWHIKKEGKIIYSRSNEMPSLLLTLPRYNNTENDLEEYSEILSDIKCELNDEYICVEYELAVLASLVRNTCIAISYLDERLDFGRNSAVMYCFSKYKINISLKEYKELYQYRLYHTNKIECVPKGKVEQLKKWIEIENDLLKIAKGRCENYDKKNM